MSNQTKSTVVLNKTIGVPLNKEIEKTNRNTIVVSGFFTSDAPDMHGDIITRSATEGAIGAYKQWGNVRRMHQPDPVGKVRGIGEGDGLEWNEVKIEVIDPKAIFEVENDLLQALSIGAMINFEDITWLENGGMLINAYVLGEISLVDHPANYDAFLRDENSAQAEVQMLVKRYGLDNVSRGMLSILKENNPMTDELEKDVTVEDEIETESITETDVENVEEEDVETTEEVEEEKEITEDATEDEELEPEMTEVVENEIVEEDDIETEVEEEDIVVEQAVDADRFEVIEQKLEVLTDLVKTLVEKEAEVVEENVSEELEEVQEDVDTEEVETHEVEHKTLIPSDDIETEDVEQDEPVRTLHRALRARFLGQ